MEFIALNRNKGEICKCDFHQKEIHDKKNNKNNIVQAFTRRYDHGGDWECCFENGFS